jgi:hypothetical protein
MSGQATEKLRVVVNECEHSGDLEQGYEVLNATSIPFIVTSERINEDSETGYVEIEVREGMGAAFITAVKEAEGEFGIVQVFKRK